MKLQYQHLNSKALRLATGLAFTAISIFENTASWATEVGKNSRVGVVIAQDRSITLTSGKKIFSGNDVSYALSKELFDSLKYETYLLNNRQEAMVGNLDFLITPVIEAMVYTSGAKSNRITFGFSPSHQHAFNAGLPDKKDNEFVVSGSDATQCQYPDFFNGKFVPPTSSPLTQSNFGADMDEGLLLSIFGFSFGYKVKKYTVGSQIRFLVENLRHGKTTEYVYRVQAGGTDKIIVLGASSISMALEIQRAETLTKALRAILPGTIKELLSDLVSPSQSGDIAEGVINENLISKTLNMPLPEGDFQTLNQAPALPLCPEKKRNLLSILFGGWFELYGKWRYDHILDQPFSAQIDGTSRAPAAINSALKIAIVDSGLDYNDEQIAPYIISSEPGKIFGFDFISWDLRPSDDNGHGTAAAKLFLKLVGQANLTLIPLKVIGPFGQTHSAAVFDAFQYAVQSHVNVIVIPWSSVPGTTGALKEGVLLAAKDGIEIFLEPGALPNETVVPFKNIHMPKAITRGGYKTKGLGGAAVGVDAAGATAVEALALWIKNGGV